MNDIMNPKAVVGTNSWGSAVYEKVLRGSVVDEESLKSAISTAAALGLTMFDTAQNYGLGRGQKMIGDLCPREILISAKYTPMSGKYEPGQVRKSLEKDMRDFRREHVDVYWLHLPNALEENLKEMAVLYREGKVRHIGISNVDLAECRRAKVVLDAEGIPLYGVQNHYSMIARDWEKKGVTGWCRDNGIAFWAWAVLEEGLLVPPHKDEKKGIMKLFFQRKRRKLKRLFAVMREIGAQHRLTEAQVAMSFVANKGLVPICGCRQPFQIEQLAAAADTVLTAGEMKRLEQKADRMCVKILGADMFRFAVKKK